MAKKKSTLGKLFTLTATVAAIGGTCYLFRDKIKESSLYKKCADALAKLSDKATQEDDFFFDDEEDSDFDDIFEADTDSNREYTSITINQKTEQDDDTADTIAEEDNSETDADNIPDNLSEEEVSSDTSANKPGSSDNMTEIFPEDNIPTIPLSASADLSVTDKEEPMSAYENEGLSDVSEEPDVLEDQDKLDF